MKGTYTWPLETLLLPGINGNTLTLGDLMKDENLTYDDAVDVMLKFRKELGITNPKEGPCCLPESSAAPKPASSQPSKPAKKAGAEETPPPRGILKIKPEEPPSKKRPPQTQEVHDMPTKTSKSAAPAVAKENKAGKKRKAKVEDEQEEELPASKAKTNNKKSKELEEEPLPKQKRSKDSKEKPKQAALSKLQAKEDLTEEGPREGEGWEEDPGECCDHGVGHDQVAAWDEGDLMFEYQLWQEERSLEKEWARWNGLSREEQYMEMIQEIDEQMEQHEEPETPRRRVRFKQPPASIIPQPEKGGPEVGDAGDEEYLEDRQPDYLGGWCVGFHSLRFFWGRTLSMRPCRLSGPRLSQSM